LFDRESENVLYIDSEGNEITEEKNEQESAWDFDHIIDL